MKKFKVTKLKVTTSATKALRQLGLTQGDLHFIISYGKRLSCSNFTLCLLDLEVLPQNRKAQKLNGVTVIIDSNEIVTVCKTIHQAIEWSNKHV